MSANGNFKRLENGGTYEMYVVNVVEARRTFQKQGATWFTHDVTLKDDQDNYYKPEYPTQSKTQIDFIPGNKIKFKCVFTAGVADEIVPIVTGRNPDIATPPNNFSVAGKSYSQALLMAVQIECARMTSTGCEFDMQATLERSDEFDQYLINKLLQATF